MLVIAFGENHTSVDLLMEAICPTFIDPPLLLSVNFSLDLRMFVTSRLLQNSDIVD